MTPDDAAGDVPQGLPAVDLSGAFARPGRDRGVALPPATRAPRPPAPHLVQVPEPATQEPVPPPPGGEPDGQSPAAPARRPATPRRAAARSQPPARPEDVVEPARVVGTYVSESGRRWLNEQATAQGDNVTNVVLDVLEDFQDELAERFASPRRAEGGGIFGTRRPARVRHPEPQVALALRLTPAQQTSLADFARRVGAPNRTRLITVAVDLARAAANDGDSGGR